MSKANFICTTPAFSDLESLVASIPDGATIALSGSGGGIQEPDVLCAAIEARFKATGHPCDLTLVHALGIGDGEKTGINRFAWPGMVKRVIGGHWTWSPRMQALARDNEIEAYTLPAGVIQHLYREIGAGRPGLITHVGMGTFADPEHGGGKCNAWAQEDLVERITLGGKTYLWYKPFKIDVALIRGSVADSKMNISARHEAADMEIVACAMAAKNNGGLVLAQVREITAQAITPARAVSVPGILVSAVQAAPEQPQLHGYTAYDPRVSGELAPPAVQAANAATKHTETAGVLGIRDIIAQRAAKELNPKHSLNFGFGIPDGVPEIAQQQGIQLNWLSVEQGLINANLLKGRLFGAGLYPQAIMRSTDQFDFYSGGGVDTAFLGLGEVDQEGNVNVSWLGKDIIGPGGFVDIAQGAKKVVFCGSLEAKGLVVNQTPDGTIQIEQYGQVAKFIPKVRHITFSGPEAIKRGQEVLYVTERAVFQLTPEGVKLIEVFKGVDAQRDVVARMGFKPL